MFAAAAAGDSKSMGGLLFKNFLRFSLVFSCWSQPIASLSNFVFVLMQFITE